MSFFSGYSSLYDLNTRLSVNDSYLGTYYFWWTNMTYLPFFFFLLLLSYLSLTFMQTGSRSLLLSWGVLLLIYPFELYDYISANLNLTIPLYHTYGLNTLLTNVLNRYHPLVFYTSVFILAQVGWTKLFRGRCSCHFATSNANSTYIQPSWLGILINLLALWMGSWWALQEGTWGGWWNWDSSEVFGLLLSLVLLTLTHSRTTRSYYPYTYHKMVYLLSSFIISYFFIQLNFELVSHNFGSKFFFFFNNNLFFIEVITLTTLLTVLFYRNFILLSAYQSSLVKATRVRKSFTDLIYPIRYFIPLILTMWVLLSYKPLVNYFFWNFFTLNLFNSEVGWQYLHTILLLLVLGWFINITQTLVALVVCVSCSCIHPLIIYLVLIRNYRLLSYLHLLIFIPVLINVILFDLTLYRWVSVSEYNYTLMSTALGWVGPVSSTLDNTALELVQPVESYRGLVDSSWNISTITNTPTLNFFNLLTSNDVFINLYNLAITYSLVYLYIELPLISSLVIIFFSLLGFVYWYLLRSPLFIV